MSATLPPPSAAAVRRPRHSLRFTRDDELVRLTRAGDPGAFEALYDRHHRGILSFCRHMLGSKEEAEDAVQHTFLAAHRDLVSSEKPIQLKAWLYTIARNRCLSLLRARKDERALEDVPEPSIEGLASQVQQRQDLQDMLVDLRRLPDDQRAALVLSELGDLSHDEIGTTLGVRKDKVKALVFQARESLASSRQARDADCEEIQGQLAVLRGGSLRRTQLRRHVEVCPACAAFKAEVQRQRAAFGVLLPVAPALATKEAVIAGTVAAGTIGGGGAAGAGVAGGLLTASAGKAVVAKVATIAVVAGGATGGGLVAVDEIQGGAGNTATAQVGIPPEQRSMELVGSLREHASVTAAARAADRERARTARPAKAAAKPKRKKPRRAKAPAAAATPAAVTAEPVVDRSEPVVTRAKVRRPKPRRERPSGRSGALTTGSALENEAPKAAAEPTSTAPAPPPPPPPAPPAPAPPAPAAPAAPATPAPEGDGGGGKGGGKWWKDKWKGKGHDHDHHKHHRWWEDKHDG